MEIARERRGGGGSRDYRAARSIVAVRLFVFLDFWKDHILTGMNGSLTRGVSRKPRRNKRRQELFSRFIPLPLSCSRR